MTNDTLDEYPQYEAPRRRTPHPDDTPLDPFDTSALQRELQTHPDTGCKRTLIAVARNISHTERQVESNLSETGITANGDLRDTTINPMREAMRPPQGTGWAAANRAKSHQTNLQSLYQQWAELCERHFRAIHRQAVEESPTADSPADSDH